MASDLVICVCGRQAYRTGWASPYRWDMWEVRHPPDNRRKHYCPPCLRAMERELKRLGCGGRYTNADLLDDASNDPEERRRLENVRAERIGGHRE